MAKRNEQESECISPTAQDIIAQIPEIVLPDELEDVKHITVRTIGADEYVTVAKWYQRGVLAFARTAAFRMRPGGGLALHGAKWKSGVAVGVEVPNSDLYHIRMAVTERLAVPNRDGTHQAIPGAYPPLDVPHPHIYLCMVTDDRFLPRDADEDVRRAAKFVSRALRGKAIPIFPPAGLGVISGLFKLTSRWNGLGHSQRPPTLDAYYTEVEPADDGEVWVRAAARVGPILILLKTRWRLNMARKLVRVRERAELTIGIPDGKDPEKVRSAILALLARTAEDETIAQAAMLADPGPFPGRDGTMRTLPHVYTVRTRTCLEPEHIPAIARAAREAEAVVIAGLKRQNGRRKNTRARKQVPRSPNPIFLNRPERALVVARALGAMRERSEAPEETVAELIRMATDNLPVSVRVKHLYHNFWPPADTRPDGVYGGLAVATTRIGPLHIMVYVEVELAWKKRNRDIGRLESPKHIARFAKTIWTPCLLYHHRPDDKEDRHRWEKRLGAVARAFSVGPLDIPHWAKANQIINSEDVEPRRHDVVSARSADITTAFSRYAPGFVRQVIARCREAIWEEARAKTLARDRVEKAKNTGAWR